MKKAHFLFLYIMFFVSLTVSAQSSFTCKVDGDDFKGKVTEALQVNLGKEDFVQIRIQAEEKTMYLYVKLSKLNAQQPIKIKYTPHNHEAGTTPDAEIIWAPEPEQPQWNTIEGELTITAYDAESKTISGEFDYVIEKAEYGAKKKKTLEVEDGKFADIQFKLEEQAKK